MSKRTLVGAVTDFRNEIDAFWSVTRLPGAEFYGIRGQLASGREPTTDWVGTVLSEAVNAEWALIRDPSGDQDIRRVTLDAGRLSSRMYRRARLHVRSDLG